MLQINAKYFLGSESALVLPFDEDDGQTDSSATFAERTTAE